MPRFSSSEAVTAPVLGSMLGPNKSSLLEVTGAVNSLGCYAFVPLLANNHPDRRTVLPREQRLHRVDELILEISDLKNEYADMAARKSFRKCSTSWRACQYLRSRTHDAWPPERTASFAVIIPPL